MAPRGGSSISESLMLIFAANPDVNWSEILPYVGIFAAFIVVLIILAVFARYFRLWVQSVTPGANTGITSRALEAHYLAGGNVPLVIRSMIAAAKAKIVDLEFKLATAIDLAGRNVLEAVQTSVNPKVIDCPAKGSAQEMLSAVAKNG